MMTKPISPSQWTTISVYLDGQLSAQQKARFEKQLQSDLHLQQAVDQLRKTRYLLRQLKPKPAPRNFVLKPEMVADIRKKTPAMRWLPVLSYSTIATAVLMVLTLATRLFPFSMKTAEAPVEMAAPVISVEDAEIQPEAGTALPIIFWGDVTYAPEIPVGKGGGGGGAEGYGVGGGGGLGSGGEIIINGPPTNITGVGGSIGVTIIIPPESSEVVSTTRGDGPPETIEKPYTVVDSGPILGLRISETAETPVEPVQPQPEPERGLPWGIPIGLGIASLVIGLSAFVLWLKTRR